MSEGLNNEFTESRCRLVLVADAYVFPPPGAIVEKGFRRVIQSGDIACMVFHSGGLTEAAFQHTIEPFVGIAQSEGIACIVHEHSRVVGRVGADGLQLGQDPVALKAAIEKFQPAAIIGAGSVKTRHNALVLGEMQPDYMMFGTPGGDTRPEPNSKNLDLGAWWSSMVEIPCVVLGGTDVESVIKVAETGVEFVALGEAVFAPHNGAIDFEAASAAVTQVNRFLDDYAPRFEKED